MPNAPGVIASLDRVMPITGAFLDAVYARLYTRHPETEDLFILDAGGHVRRAMIDTALTCLRDAAGPQAVAPGLVRAARFHHTGYGVEPEIFSDFFAIVRESVEAALGPAWSASMAGDWDRVLDALAEWSAAPHIPSQ